jgi:peptide-O-fucosyltransferase
LNKAFCYSSRGENTCNAKEGNPFGPFWDHFGVEFDSNEFYGPLGYDPLFGNHMIEWKQRYSHYPVLAFTGAPGAFPVQENHVPLQKYLKWSDNINKRADEVIAKLKTAPTDRVIALHLRNGVDFVSAEFRQT